MTDADRKLLDAIAAALNEYERDGRIAGVLVELDAEDGSGPLHEWDGQQMRHVEGFKMRKVGIDAD